MGVASVDQSLNSPLRATFCAFGACKTKAIFTVRARDRGAFFSTAAIGSGALGKSGWITTDFGAGVTAGTAGRVGRGARDGDFTATAAEGTLFFARPSGTPGFGSGALEVVFGALAGGANGLAAGNFDFIEVDFLFILINSNISGNE
jgi:hypothetical protein